MIKLKDLLTEAPQIKKVKNVSMQYFDAEYAGDMAFSGYFRKAWLYKKDNGEWFAVIITKNKNKYEIQLGKHKDKLSADKAAEKLIKRSLNKLESINKGKLKLTKDKPKKITQRIWSAPKRIMTKSAYLRMPDINKKRRDGVDYVATSIGPKKTQVYLPVIFESINEGKVTYKLKGFTNTKMDELDAELSRLGIKGTPDFNKMTYTIHMKGSNTHMLDKLMKKKGGKKIKESVNEAQNELISTSKDIKTYKGKKVPKGKYEVINARGQFATLMRIHDKVDGGNVYNLVPLNTLSKVASRLKESINEAPGNNHKDQYVGQARVKVEPYTYKNQVRNFHDVSMYRNHKKPYNYYLSIVLAHNKTTAKVDYIVDTGTHILSKAGKWAQNFIKRRMSGTGRERFS